MNYLALINAILPIAANIITIIRNQDGTLTAVAYLDQADAQFATNAKQISDWFAAHGKPAPTPN
jgi:hypothetical protein